MAKENLPKYCLSLWQPWAMLWALGEKMIETRHWELPPSMVGREIYIHAATRWTGQEKEICRSQIFREAFARHLDLLGCETQDQIGVTYRHVSLGDGYYIKLPFGCLIGTVQLVNSIPTTGPASYFSSVKHPAKERAFGNYEPGRFAWIGKNHKLLPSFVPVIGHQRFFKAPVLQEIQFAEVNHG